MAEGRRHLRSSTASKCIPEKLLLGDMTSTSPLIDEQRERIQLRQRWELAYVLNFLRVFRPVIPKDLKIPAEEIEMALIAANKNLERIHIALLKGIPPINKSNTDSDAWITSVCKKLAKWRPWVAEGENPLRADHGREIPLYKQLDPTARLLILKALCDVRAEQDDVLEFIEDELKKGATIGSFRKERMEVDDSGVTYWYEGDPVIGYRLYRETGKTYSKQKAKGKGCVEPSFESQWETIAINVDDFPGIMHSLSSSKIPGEASVGEALKAQILPVFKKLEQKKARQQRLALQLEGFLNCRVGHTRSCRDRRPARYTFDEYDRSIEEAIRISTETDNVEPKKANGEQYKNGLSKEYPSSKGSDMDALNEISGNDDDPKSSEVSNDAKNSDNSSNYDDTVDSDSERHGRHSNVKLVSGLRRSSRNFDSYHAVTKKRLRQRPTKNSDYNEAISSDSEDENPAKSIKQTAVGLSSSGDDSSATAAASGDESQEESGKDLF